MTFPETFIDLFSGIGGFRLALERLGLRCVWSCDNDRKANAIYANIHFGRETHCFRDIRKVDAEEIPDHDLLCAGFPCQAFSIAGKREGFEDTRGTLFYDIARIAEAKRPPLLLLENVKGLLSAQGGYCFWRILQTLDELGYWVEWQVLNSKHFGVPQNRERVFIVGHSRAKPTKAIFPLQEIGKDTIGTQEKTQGKGSRVRVANTLSSRYYKDGSENLIASSLVVGGQGRERNLIYRHPLNYGKKSVYSEEDTYPSLRTIQRHPQPKSIIVFGAKASHPNSISSALRANPHDGFGGRAWLQEGLKIRRLTPVECERLQGFPDDWTKGISDTHRYRLLGNAVTVNVVEAIGRALLSG